MLAVMLQLSANGKPFDQIINDSMANLYARHPDTFRCFCILCAFHRLGMPTPSTVLDCLMNKSLGFISILRSDVVEEKSRCGAHGLIFLGDFFLYHECWQTAHELIAEAAVYSEYACNVEFASHEEAVIFTGDPNVEW